MDVGIVIKIIYLVGHDESWITVEWNSIDNFTMRFLRITEKLFEILLYKI